MKQEEMIKTLVKELMELDELHQEYQDKDTHFVVDSQKEGNTLTIKVQLLENKDKEQFEKWLESIDDDILSEVLEEVNSDGDLNELYNSENYKQVINKVKSKTKEIVDEKIKYLKAIKF